MKVTEIPGMKIIAVLILGALSLVFLFEKGFIRFNYPSKEDFPVRGLDISHHQGLIDWQVLKNEKLDFLYFKATEGGDYLDSMFKQNFEAAWNEGYVVGAYHYYRFCTEGVKQAKHFIKTVPKRRGMLRPAIDLEYAGSCAGRKSKEEEYKELFIFLEMLEQYYGAKPVLYFTPDFYQAYYDSRFAPYPLWYRDIYFEPEEKDYLIWQFSNRGRVKGIKGPVDLNAMADEADLANLIMF